MGKILHSAVALCIKKYGAKFKGSIVSNTEAPVIRNDSGLCISQIATYDCQQVADLLTTGLVRP